MLEWRTKNANLVLAKPTGKRIVVIVELIEQHWNLDQRGTAKLPVLATYAAYRCLVAEVSRYKDCNLLEMLSHTSADVKTKRLGDVEVRRNNDEFFEAVEIKHKVKITRTIVNDLREQIAGSGVRTFYILSTDENLQPDELTKITELILEIRQIYGCQVIVNGVATTIEYYLRLLSSPDKFVYEYANLMEKDDEIRFELKREWNKLID